jgi:hypothetical protein
MLSDAVQLENDENKIRDVLVINYLENKDIRKGTSLENFIFNREAPEANSPGRTDIKIETYNTFKNCDAYYIIECKRLDSKNLKGKTGLNAEYINNGIRRFVSQYYSSHCGTNAMIGFAIDKFAFATNYQNINFIMKTYFFDINVVQPLQPENFISDFEYQYSSQHDINGNKKLILFHLLFDFSKNIKN